MALKRKRISRPAKVVAAFTTVAVLGTGTVFVASSAASGTGRYRLASAEQRAVAQVLDEVGVIEPVSQASVAFPASGTVATVDVAAGDVVAAGDTLASLDPTSAQRSLHEAQATLAEAELRLEKALNGESVSSGSGFQPTSATSGDSGTAVIQLASLTTTAAAAGTAVTDEQMRAAQQAVLDAQKQVDTDLAAVDEAIADAEILCTWPDTDAGADPDTDAGTDSGADSGTDSGTGTDTDTDGSADTAQIEACRAALGDVLSAQQATAASQRALADAATALDGLLATWAASLSESGSSSGSGSGSGSGPSEPQSGTGGSGSGGRQQTPSGSGTPEDAASLPSSADLIAYQAAVDAAEASVAVAEQAVEQATIVSPIAGTVVTVGFTAGDDVSAASADQAIVIAGSGGYEVTVTVSVTDLPDLEVGGQATVVPDGTGTELTGRVVSIAVASTSSSGTASYPVTIALDDPGAATLRNGGIATVSITTAATTEALAVPTSAVTVDGDQATVTTFDGATTQEVTVRTGAVGPTWTEIVSGLEAGDQVVLADLDAGLPSSATSGQNANTTTGGGGGAGFQRFQPGRQ